LNVDAADFLRTPTKARAEPLGLMAGAYDAPKRSATSAASPRVFAAALAIERKSTTMRSMYQEPWSDPLPLAKYRAAPFGSGLYGAGETGFCR
jgi:hypothetical protein